MMASVAFKVSKKTAFIFINLISWPNRGSILVELVRFQPSLVERLPPSQVNKFLYNQPVVKIICRTLAF